MKKTADTTRTHYFAVFGDIHGRVALMYVLSQLWQNYTGNELTNILQVGDMGAFPDHTRLDSATIKHARRDPDELDFKEYCYKSPSCNRYLGSSDLPSTYFIRGNHEDFDYLDGFRPRQSVDPWKQLRYLPDGSHVNLRLLNEETTFDELWTGEQEDNQHVECLCLAGFGGIQPRSRDRGRGKKARKNYRKNNKKISKEKKFFSSDALSVAFSSLESIDILMTHAGPQCERLPGGSYMLTQLAERIQPTFHFFGHHHVVIEPTQQPWGSTLVGLDHLDFTKDGILFDNAWGILEWNETPTFTMANTDTMPWLREVRRDNYRSMFKTV